MRNWDVQLLIELGIMLSGRRVVSKLARGRQFMTAKDLVVNEEEKVVPATNKLNLFSAVNQALLTVLESDPK